jgi:tetratricopeptide (TPR) repeat protein
VKSRIHRLSQIAPLLTAALLLGGCALFPIGKQAHVPDPGPGTEVRPDASPEYDVLVALGHQARGDLEESLVAFERALEKDPDSAYIHLKLAGGLIGAGRPAE